MDRGFAHTSLVAAGLRICPEYRGDLISNGGDEFFVFEH
jgi:hypothetical protein